MKNKELQNDIKTILSKDNVLVEKSTATNNAINVYVLSPIYEDIGTYLYTDVTIFESDFDMLKALLADKQSKTKN